MQLHSPLGHACYTKRGKTLDVRIGSKPARETSTLRSGRATVSPMKRAERLGGASRIGRRRLRVARAGNLRDRAVDARSYRSVPFVAAVFSGAKMVPGTVRQT